VEWDTDNPWYVQRSAQIVEMISDFNSTRVSEEIFIRTGGWQGFDFARLYMNIPQDDLIRALQWILQQLLWRKHGTEQRLLKVYRDNFQEAEWQRTEETICDVHDSLGDYYNRLDRDERYVMKTERLGVDKNLSEFYLFDYREACNMGQLLVSHAYVTFGGAVYHQTQGIPMGINPAVYMANYYLYYYEYTFLRQLWAICQQSPPVDGGCFVADL
jgi:hypothetical protein